MAWQGLIFDCDGTLVDSERIANEVLIEYLADFGVELSMRESAARFNGLEVKDAVAQIEQIIGAALPPDFVTTMRERLDRALVQRLEPVVGVATLIDALRVPYCIASNAPMAKIELSLRVTGLRSRFRGPIHSAYEVGAWKPDPALFLHAARSLNAPPQCCAVVEDSLPGVRAGVAAGMTVFAYQPHEVDSRLPPQARIFTYFGQLHAVLREAGVAA